MNKTIASLALLKVSWDTARRKDYLENFVPFLVTLISRKGYATIKTRDLCRDFQAEYGLVVPYHPMISLVTRAARSGYIQKTRAGLYVPVHDRVSADDFTDVALQQEREYNKVLNQFLAFCRDKYKQTLSEADAETAFIAFLRDHDLDILFISQERSTVLPEATASTAQKFLVNSFVKHVHESDPEIFQFLVDMSIGHIVANTLLFRDLGKLAGTLYACSVYLDIGFLFNVFGINDLEKREAYVEFVHLLHAQGAHLYVFEHTYDEFMGILEGSLQWVQSVDLDPLRASRTTTYFVENGYTASDVERLIAGAPRRLAELNVKVVAPPTVREDEQYQIDEVELTDTIVAIYKDGVPDFDELEKEYTIYRDVRSISAVFKLRKDETPTTLQDATHIFLTTNATLARAARVFEARLHPEKRFFIPSALTDVFVGTLMWIRSPTKAKNVAEKRLIADCYAATQPTKEMARRLFSAAQRLKSQGEIDQEEVTLLTQSRVARNLLQEETLGDPERFSDRTILDILEELRRGIREEERKALETERKSLDRQEQERLREVDRQRQLASQAQQSAAEVSRQLEAAMDAKLHMEHNIESVAQRVSSAVTWMFRLVAVGTVIVVCVLPFYPKLLGNNSLLYVMLVLLAVVLTAANLITGFNVRGSGAALQTWLRGKICRILGGGDPRPQ
jgi:hypothetical protein